MISARVEAAPAAQVARIWTAEVGRLARISRPEVLPQLQFVKKHFHLAGGMQKKKKKERNEQKKNL